MSSSKKPMRRTGRGLIINKNRNRKESPYISKHVITVDDEESDDISNNHHDRDYTNGEEEEDAGQGIQSSPGYLDGGILGNIGVPKDFREKIQGMSPANGQCSQLDPTVVGRRKRRRNRGNHATKGSLTLTPHAAAPYMGGQSGLLDKKKAAIPAEHSRTKEDLRNGHARHNNNNKKKKHQRGYQDILQGLQPDAKKTPKRSQGKSVRGFPGLTEQKQQSESPCSPKSNNDMQYRIPKKTQDQKLEFEVERTRGGLSGLHVSSSLQNQKKESREKHSTTDVLNLCDCSSESDSDENNTKQKPQDSSEERVTKRKRQDDDGEPNANKRRVRDGAGDYMSTVEKRTNKQKDARKRRDKKRRASTDTANFDSYKDPEKRKNAPSKAGPEKDSNKQRKDATSEKQANERAVRKSKACQLSDDSDAETVDGEQSKGIDAIDEIFNCKKKPGSAKPSTGHFGLIKKDTIESTHSESNSGAPSSNKQRKESSSDKSAASFSVSNRGAHGAKTASKPSAAIQTRLATPRATSQQTSLGFAASSQKNPLYEHQAPTSAPSKLSCAGQNAPKPWSLHGESSNSRLHEDDAGSGRRKSTGTSTDNTNKTEQSGSRLSFKKVTTEANRGRKISNSRKRGTPITAGSSFFLNNGPTQTQVQSDSPILLDQERRSSENFSASTRKSNRSTNKYADDEEYKSESTHLTMVASPTKTPRRSARKNIASTPKPPDIVDLMGSDDEPDDSLPSASQEDKAQVELKRRVARIALGNSVYPTDCRLVYNNKNCTLSLFGKRSTRRGSSESLVDIDFRDDSVLQIKSFYGNTGRQEPNFSFLAFQVKPSEANQLGKFKTSYKFDQREDADHKSYVVVQFLSDEDCRNFFSDILGGMDSGYADRLLKLHEHFEEQSEALKYVAALRSRSAKPYEKKETDNFVAGRAEDDVLLVYPFDGDTDEIEGAADELNEAKGVNAIIGVEETPTTSDEESSLRNRGSEQDATEGSFSDEKQGIVSRKSERRHFLTIQVRDFERLCPGEFLNDTLVDFWIQWITRNLDGFGPKVHCFSSHFFTTLIDEGPRGVQKWTAKKGINIFEKKFVFIPVNETLHWSLCVVVNPGYIENRGEDDHVACLLFLDSLKAHRKSKVYNKVVGWLNEEWKRVKGRGDEPFRKKDFPLLDPKIPYQNNSWDCGVFVCKYAHAVYSLVNRDFLRNDPWFQKNLIENCEEFQFNMRDIKRLREEIRTLIENLSKIYLPWKEGKDRKLKEGRHKARVEKKNASEQLTLNTSVNTPASASEKAQDPENSTENATNIASVEDGTSLSNGLTEMETEAVHESPNHNTEIENDDESATTEDVNEATDFAQKVKEKVESDGEEREDIENEGSRAKRENQMDDSDMETSSMELETAHVTVNPLVACISEKEKKRNKVVGITPPKPLTKKVQYSASKLERCTSPYCLNKEEQFDEV